MKMKIILTTTVLAGALAAQGAQADDTFLRMVSGPSGGS
jgi:hypothetical protein